MHDVVRRDPVAGDHQDPVAEVVHLSDLPAGDERKVGYRRHGSAGYQCVRSPPRAGRSSARDRHRHHRHRRRRRRRGMARLPRLGAAPRRARARPRAPEHRGPRPPPAARGQRRARQRDHAGGRAALRARRRAPHGGRAPRAPGRRPRSASPARRRPPPRSSRRAASAPARPPRATTSAPPRPRIASSSCRAVGPAVHGRYRNRGHPSLRARLGPFACPRRHRRPADGPRRAHLPHRPAPGRRGGPRVRAALLALLRPAAQGRRLLDDRCPDRHDLRQRRPAGQAREPADRRAPPAHGAGLPAAQRRPRRARCASAPATCAPWWR